MSGISPNIFYVGITGAARSGKDSLAMLIEKTLGKEYDVVSLSLAAPLKRMAMCLFDEVGWPNDKGSIVYLGGLEAVRAPDLKENPDNTIGVSPRRVLQTLGTDWGRTVLGDDVWLTLLKSRALAMEIPQSNPLRTHSDKPLIVLVPDCRFNNEAEAMDLVYSIRRDEKQEVEAHVSEAGVSAYLISKHVDNNGSWEELQDEAVHIAQEIKDYVTRIPND